MDTIGTSNLRVSVLNGREIKVLVATHRDDPVVRRLAFYQCPFHSEMICIGPWLRAHRFLVWHPLAVQTRTPSDHRSIVRRKVIYYTRFTKSIRLHSKNTSRSLQPTEYRVTHKRCSRSRWKFSIAVVSRAQRPPPNEVSFDGERSIDTWCFCYSSGTTLYDLVTLIEIPRPAWLSVTRYLPVAR